MPRHNIAHWLPCLLIAACRLDGCQDEQLVHRWLTCIECTDGELDSMKAIGHRDRDGLRTRLQNRLLDGPSQGLKVALRRRFEQSYNLLYANPDSNERARYVDANLIGFTSTWRVRAATALAGLGNAQVALDSAAKGLFRDPADSLLSPVAKRLLMLARDSLSQHPWQASATTGGARSTAGPRVVAPPSSASTRTPVRP